MGTSNRGSRSTRRRRRTARCESNRFLAMASRSRAWCDWWKRVVDRDAVFGPSLGTSACFPRKFFALLQGPQAPDLRMRPIVERLVRTVLNGQSHTQGSSGPDFTNTRTGTLGAHQHFLHRRQVREVDRCRGIRLSASVPGEKAHSAVGLDVPGRQPAVQEMLRSDDLLWRLCHVGGRMVLPTSDSASRSEIFDLSSNLLPWRRNSKR